MSNPLVAVILIVLMVVSAPLALAETRAIADIALKNSDAVHTLKFWQPDSYILSMRKGQDFGVEASGKLELTVYNSKGEELAKVRGHEPYHDMKLTSVSVPDDHVFTVKVRSRALIPVTRYRIGLFELKVMTKDPNGNKVCVTGWQLRAW